MAAQEGAPIDSIPESSFGRAKFDPALMLQLRQLPTLVRYLSPAELLSVLTAASSRCRPGEAGLFRLSMLFILITRIGSCNTFHIVFQRYKSLVD